MKRKIVVLCHEKTQRFRLEKYMIFYLTLIWREQGHSVKFLFGTKEFIPADICIVHVDLSFVPDEYLEFAHRYSIVLNGKIQDIRKSTISKNLISRNSDYNGPVLVKTNYNYAGWPEKVAGLNSLSLMIASIARKLPGLRTNIVRQQQYQYYPTPDNVPTHYFLDEHFVVEKFLPEMSENLYCVNFLKFFGDINICTKLYSKNRIVTDIVEEKREFIEPHPEILKIRETLDIDFGKLDYCMVDGEAVLLDINKTSGIVSKGVSEENWKEFRVRATGINYFL